jgi:glutathione peroxidase
MTFYDISVEKSDGSIVRMDSFRNRVLLIVNTASKCGFVSQYAELQGLHDRYSDQGLVVMAFPCDQFLNQEFADNDSIQQFCQINYGLTFPVFAKIDVRGESAHPLFRYLVSNKSGLLGQGIKWNFTKFLIDGDGNVFRRYAPTTKPFELDGDIRRLIAGLKPTGDNL